MVLGERVAQLRKAAGMAQVELAVAIGDRYNQQMVSHIENGRSGLLVDGLIQVARVFEVSTDYLLGLTENPAPAADLAGDIRPIDETGKSSRVQEDPVPYSLKPYGAFADCPAAIEGDIKTVLERSHFGHSTIHLSEVKLEGIGNEVSLEKLPEGWSRTFQAPKSFYAAGEPELWAAIEKDRHLFEDNRLPDNLIDPTLCVVARVSGCSMEPTLPNGTAVIVDKKSTRRSRRSGRVFLVNSPPHGLAVKRAGRGPEGYWYLFSDNPAWETVHWPTDAVVVGEVRWVARTF